MELTKAQCNELRGLAILSIVLHNFFHQERFGFAQQNEGSFDLGRTADFLAGLGDGLGNALCEISSFLGWLGVPVFVFLSGYGLARKYESSPAGSLAVLPHIKHSWLKLFKLMLPGVLFCAVFMQMSGYGGAGAMARYAVYLSLLGNLAGMPAPTPGVYWYFGLTFELYVCYILFERYRDRRILLAGFVLPLLLQFFLLLTGKDGLLNYNLNNLVGWLPVFVTGIGAARLRRENGNPRNNALLPVLLLAVSSALLVACNLSRWGWGGHPFRRSRVFLRVDEPCRPSRPSPSGLWLPGILGILLVRRPPHRPPGGKKYPSGRTQHRMRVPAVSGFAGGCRHRIPAHSPEGPVLHQDLSGP